MNTTFYKSLIMASGESLLLIAEIIPKKALNYNVRWTTSDESIVMVTGGKLPNNKIEAVLYGGNEGTAEVTALIKEYLVGLGNDFSDTIKVRVIPHNVFWCQTGGWFGEVNDGRKECARTAIATMVSLNLEMLFTPDQTIAGSTKITINGITDDEGYSSGQYYDYDVTNNGTHHGFNRYTFTTEQLILAAINYELSNGRVVVVHTNGAGGHWVTVTSTLTGQPATQFSDLIGIDPWFNGTSPPNPSVGSGDGSSNAEKSGVIHLLNAVKNQTDFHWAKNPNIDKFGYNMFTINFD